MDRLTPLTRLSRLTRLAGLLAAAIVAGCDLIHPAPPPISYEARPGDVVLQLVDSDSRSLAFDPGARLDGPVATGTTIWRYRGRIGDTLSFSREAVTIAPRRQGGGLWVAIPAGFANTAITSTGTSDRYPPEAYAPRRLKGTPERLPVETRTEVTVPVPLDPEARLRITWEGYALDILSADPALIRYRLTRLE